MSTQAESPIAGDWPAAESADPLEAATNTTPGTCTPFDVWHVQQLQKELTLKHLELPCDMNARPSPARTALPPDRRALIVRIAPAAPPCFHDRLAWLEYLVEAQASAKGSERGPLDMRSGVPQFNYELDFCADCSARHVMAMQRARRCRPDHLRELVSATEAVSA